MTSKSELKKKAVEIISQTSTLTKKSRLETICRAQINRLSYSLQLGDHCIFLEKNGRIILIESRCSDKGDGWGKPAYIRAFNESLKIIDAIKTLIINDYEETLRNNRQAV